MKLYLSKFSDSLIDIHTNEPRWGRYWGLTVWNSRPSSILCISSLTESSGLALIPWHKVDCRRLFEIEMYRDRGGAYQFEVDPRWCAKWRKLLAPYKSWDVIEEWYAI